uniref:Putative similar to chymotrypsin-elastase inhibitor ixodidin n=1 Tax=Rhipicephalus pulchellus TaxID=72859 RepID=L7MAF7_RHIPC
MAGNSRIFFSLWLTAIALVLSEWKFEGSEAIKINKKCQPGEEYGCVGKHPVPECGENKCGVEIRRVECAKICRKGCWCKGKMYRRKRDNKCVPKHECLM